MPGDAPARVPSGIAGARYSAPERVVDSRWLMAYAAVLGETDPAYFNTAQCDRMAVHPLFPVCYEWPAWLELARRILPAEVTAGGVHSAHELVWHRPVSPGDRVRVHARLLAVAPKAADTQLVIGFENLDPRGRTINVSRAAWFCPGVAADPEIAEDAVPMARPERVADDAAPEWSVPVPVVAGLAHCYTECARIYNPIHTDIAVARAAGLSAPILHGTATLALAVSAAGRQGMMPPRRLHAVFRQPVVPPAGLVVEGFGMAGSATGSLRVRRDDGTVALNATLG